MKIICTNYITTITTEYKRKLFLLILFINLFLHLYDINRNDKRLINEFDKSIGYYLIQFISFMGNKSAVEHKIYFKSMTKCCFLKHFSYCFARLFTVLFDAELCIRISSKDQLSRISVPKWYTLAIIISPISTVLYVKTSICK